MCFRFAELPEYDLGMLFQVGIAGGETSAGGVAIEGSVLGGDKALAGVGAGAEGSVGTMREPSHTLRGQWSRQGKVTVLPWVSTV